MKFFGIFFALVHGLICAEAQNTNPFNQARSRLSNSGSSQSLMTCNNWLRTQAVGQSVTVGDLDVTGNKITVEAQYNRVLPAANSYILEDIVSKHGDPANVNYLLRPDHAEITTTNGFFQTAPICITQPNRSYHVALVYDGSLLKFYRNGFLMSQVAVTGNLILNDLSTTIGDYAYPNPLGSNFHGYINEVRIWNVARTQTQIQTYMNTSLPNPTTQTGLLAYYTFESLLNKQGNATWNGTLTGGGTINNTNPDCFFLVDSCNVLQGLDNVINDYTPVISLNSCNNSLVVQDAQEFNVGDTVLIIQMKGSLIDSSNSIAFGNITNYRNAGNYEFNYVSQKSGNIVTLKNKLTRAYDLPGGKVQLIRVPYYSSASITSTLTCAPWDGSKGGVLVLNVRDTITMNANIDVSGKGFSGGLGVNTNQLLFNCFEDGFYYDPSAGDSAAVKGEGITIVSNNKLLGRGKLANGGGGGNSHNAGGGGGSNAGSGGLGGYQLEACGNAPFDNRGIGGTALQYNTASNKIFMGGGGGAGHVNNPQGFTGSGGNGGGIAIIRARYIKNTGKFIIADGLDALPCTLPGSACHEGMGGGGAGGTIVLDVSNINQSTNITVVGGKGGNMTDGDNGKLGPGGGGGGGLVWYKTPTQPVNVTSIVSGGISGKCINYANDPWGATNGSNGSVLFNAVVPIDSILFTTGVLAVNAGQDTAICSSGNVNHTLQGTTSGTIYSWTPAALLNNSTLPNPTATLSSTTTFYFNASDAFGCSGKDSVTITIKQPPVLTIQNNAALCSGDTLKLVSTGVLTFQWSPPNQVSDPLSSSPVFIGTTNQNIVVTGMGANGCSAGDTLSVAVKPSPDVNTVADTSICSNQSVTLTTSGALSYSWSPATYLSSSTAQSPVFTGNINQTYVVTGIAANGCKAKDTVTVNIRNTTLNAPPAKEVCIGSSVQLDGNNGPSMIYAWTTSPTLFGINTISPIASPSTSTTYEVLISDSTCNTDSLFRVPVTVNPLPAIAATKANDIDCAHIFALLNASGGVSYSWSPATTLNDAAIRNPIATPQVNTQYIVSGTDAKGCKNADSVTVDIKSAKVEFHIPNSFTPNGDGLNECFGINHFGQIQNLIFIIYNRYGEKVFQTNNVAQCWNGSFKGSPANPGGYVYYIKGKSGCGDIERKGNLLLIR